MESMDTVQELCEALDQQPAHWPDQTHAPEAPPRLVARRRRGWRLPWRVAAVLAFGLTLIPPPRAHAATFACGAGHVDCLIAAIHEANANGEENTITLAAGIYTLTAVNETDGLSGLPSITSVLTLEGAGADTTILARVATAPEFRLMHVAASGTLTLARVTLRGNRGGGEGEFLRDGGGLYNDAGTVTLTQSTVTGFRVDGEGGGVYNNAGTVTLMQSTVAENVNDGRWGGALFNDAGTLTLVQSTVTGNNGGLDGAGGFASIGGTVTLTQSTVDGNRANFGTAGLSQRGGDTAHHPEPHHRE